MRILLSLTLACSALFCVTSVQAASLPLREILKGQLLLQVQSHGEAWYVAPQDGKRYYLANGTEAYAVMRSFGLGITTADLSKLLAREPSFLLRLKGRIVLKVQAHGEAYYVCPRDLSVRYLKDGVAAFQIMRACGLGITNINLSMIPVGELQSTVVSNPTPVPVSVGMSESKIAGCSIFPADNPWNQDISLAALHPQSGVFMASIGLSSHLHPDFGYAEYGQYGFPITIVSGSQPKVPITFTAYGDQSDPGPYPVPSDAKIESGSDRHVLVVDTDVCILYELFNAAKIGTVWSADSGAIWDLKSNALRPQDWTSADAAGLPIMPGLVRYDEVAAGEIKHAIRFTAYPTQRGYILPATHQAGTSDNSLPPMGLRVRLKADYDLTHLTGQAKVIATAMKKYGLILADNGGDWFFSGENDARWNDDELDQLKQIPGSAFEAVYTGEIVKR